MYEIVAKRQLASAHVFQARLGGVPLGPWQPTKELAVRDILKCGVQGEVVDRTDLPPRVDRGRLGWA